LIPGEEKEKGSGLAYGHNLGGCLPDDMGLGKTLQAITLLASIYPQEKAPLQLAAGVREIRPSTDGLYLLSRAARSG